jgi:hypothetical protein
MDVGIKRDPIPHPRREITFDHYAMLRLTQGWILGHTHSPPGEVLMVKD